MNGTELGNNIYFILVILYSQCTRHPKLHEFNTNKVNFTLDLSAGHNMNILYHKISYLFPHPPTYSITGWYNINTKQVWIGATVYLPNHLLLAKFTSRINWIISGKYFIRFIIMLIIAYEILQNIIYMFPFYIISFKCLKIIA